MGSLPKAEWLLADRGYDADWFRDALKDRGIKPCIPGRKSRGKPIKHDKRRYKRRNRIEIMFGRLKDWRRVATRYDRCPKAFLSAIALAATVMSRRKEGARGRIIRSSRLEPIPAAAAQATFRKPKQTKLRKTAHRMKGVERGLNPAPPLLLC